MHSKLQKKGMTIRIIDNKKTFRATMDYWSYNCLTDFDYWYTYFLCILKYLETNLIVKSILDIFHHNHLAKNNLEYR